MIDITPISVICSITIGNILGHLAIYILANILAYIMKVDMSLKQFLSSHCDDVKVIIGFTIMFSLMSIIVLIILSRHEN